MKILLPSQTQKLYQCEWPSFLILKVAKVYVFETAHTSVTELIYIKYFNNIHNNCSTVHVHTIFFPHLVLSKSAYMTTINSAKPPNLTITINFVS